MDSHRKPTSSTLHGVFIWSNYVFRLGTSSIHWLIYWCSASSSLRCTSVYIETHKMLAQHSNQHTAPIMNWERTRNLSGGHSSELFSHALLCGGPIQLHHSTNSKYSTHWVAFLDSCFQDPYVPTWDTKEESVAKTSNVWLWELTKPSLRQNIPTKI